MSRYRIQEFKIRRNSRSGDTLLLIRGARSYKMVFRRSFPDLFFSTTFEDHHGIFDWGTYIKGADESDRQALEQQCRSLSSYLFLEDDLDITLALALHQQIAESGGLERTEVGEMIRQAKPYDRRGNRGDRDKAEELGGLLAHVVTSQPVYAKADCIVSVPPSNHDKTFDLPTVLAEVVSSHTGIPFQSQWIEKTRRTLPMKRCRTIREKVDNIKDAYRASHQHVVGRRIIVVDDIYQSGFSINEVGRVLKEAGAVAVMGLVATKTMQDMVENSDDE